MSIVRQYLAGRSPLRSRQAPTVFPSLWQMMENKDERIHDKNSKLRLIPKKNKDEDMTEKSNRQKS